LRDGICTAATNSSYPVLIAQYDHHIYIYSSYILSFHLHTSRCHFEADAMGMTEKIYHDLSIPGFAEARGDIEKYVGGTDVLQL